MKVPLRAGLICQCALLTGTLDLLYACWKYGELGVRPLRILQSIASGLLGSSAFSLGWSSALLGILCHFAILGFAITVLLVVLQRFASLQNYAACTGAAFGAILFLVMNYAVVPLSAAPVQPPKGHLLVGAVLIHVLGIGIPAALIVSRALQREAGGRTSADR